MRRFPLDLQQKQAKNKDISIFFCIFNLWPSAVQFIFSCEIRSKCKWGENEAYTVSAECIHTALQTGLQMLL